MKDWWGRNRLDAGGWWLNKTIDIVSDAIVRRKRKPAGLSSLTNNMIVTEIW